MQLRGVMGSHCLKVIAQTQTYLVYSLANATHTHSTCPIVGKFYLVDVGYACRPGFLPPYRGVRYHLSEYGPRNRPDNARELFNLRHSSLRVTMERAIGALKLRFRILDNKPFHKYRTQVKLVVACAILHNWILGFGMDEVVPMRLISLVHHHNHLNCHVHILMWAPLTWLQRGMPSVRQCGQGGETIGFETMFI
jgi:hypothetical protein